MARTINRLSAVKIAKLSKPGRYGDGGGLWLQVSRFNTKAWLFRFMLAGRARQMGLVFDVVPSERLVEEAVRLLQSGEWQALRQRKQLPVGLTEEQHSFTFAVARGQVMEKTKGQMPAPLAAIDAGARGCDLPLDGGWLAPSLCRGWVVNLALHEMFI